MLLEEFDFERNAVIINSNTIDYHILIKRAGGWRTDSYNEFFIDNDDTSDQLPSFHFDRFMNAVFNDSIDLLSPDEQVLALCLNLKKLHDIPLKDICLQHPPFLIHKYPRIASIPRFVRKTNSLSKK